MSSAVQGGLQTVRGSRRSSKLAAWTLRKGRSGTPTRGPGRLSRQSRSSGSACARCPPVTCPILCVCCLLWSSCHHQWQLCYVCSAAHPCMVDRIEASPSHGNTALSNPSRLLCPDAESCVLKIACCSSTHARARLRAPVRCAARAGYRLSCKFPRRCCRKMRWSCPTCTSWVTAARPTRSGPSRGGGSRDASAGRGLTWQQCRSSQVAPPTPASQSVEVRPVVTSKALVWWAQSHLVWCENRVSDLLADSQNR